jgi:hypothetical protein
MILVRYAVANTPYNRSIVTVQSITKTVLSDLP